MALSRLRSRAERESNVFHLRGLRFVTAEFPEFQNITQGNAQSADESDLEKLFPKDDLTLNQNKLFLSRSFPWFIIPAMDSIVEIEPFVKILPIFWQSHSLFDFILHLNKQNFRHI